MNSSNGVTPPSPFTPRGKVYNKSNAQIREMGLDGSGIPAAPEQNVPVNGRSGPARPGGSRGQNIAQLAQSIGDMELANSDDLHAFCDAYRAILYYLAISAKLAEGQLKAAARIQAKNAKDGWMTPAQRIKLADTLRRVGRDIDSMANSCTDAATGAVKAWRRYESLLDELENGPTSRRSGGFTI